MDQPLSGRRMLVVDDEAIVCAIAGAMLDGWGCESVVISDSIEDALARLGAQSFDLAMLDLRVAGRTSYPVADALIERGVPFFFATGFNGDEIEDSYRSHPYLSKPFKRQELLEVCTRVLAQPVGTASF